MTLLDEDVRARIRAEEAFRAEVKKQFSKPKPPAWWTFVNSAFGLWLLGSVTLTGTTTLATWLYQRYALERQEASARADMKAKLFEELANRLRISAYSLQIYEYAHRGLDRTRPIPELDQIVLGTMNGAREALHPEFSGVPAATLFYRFQKFAEKADRPFENAQYNWGYLEPKLRMDQSSFSELEPRLAAIANKLYSSSSAK
jgi:hypothetical protein